MRWTVGILTGFAILFAVNGTMIWLAFTGQEPIAASYQERE